MINGFGNDIVLIKLSYFVLFSDRVGLVCLLSGNYKDWVLLGSKCFVLGE